MPGPNGLPGSYPIRLGEEGAELVLPGISEKEAVEINKKGARFDGIERVKDDAYAKDAWDGISKAKALMKLTR